MPNPYVDLTLTVHCITICARGFMMYHILCIIHNYAQIDVHNILSCFIPNFFKCIFGCFFYFKNRDDLICNELAAEGLEPIRSGGAYV